MLNLYGVCLDDNDVIRIPSIDDTYAPLYEHNNMIPSSNLGGETAASAIVDVIGVHVDGAHRRHIAQAAYKLPRSVSCRAASYLLATYV